MKFSIVVPCFNEENYLPRLLDSINKVDWPRSDFEIIAVDNNCTDRTAEIARGLGTDKIVKESNQGLAWARQRGFLSSQGEVFCSVDADCEMPSNWLKIVDSFLSREGVVAVSGFYNYIDLGRLDRTLTNAFQKFIYPLVPKILKLIFRKPAGLITGANFAAKRWAIEKTGGFNTAIRFWGEDADMAMKLAKVGKVIFTPKLEIRTSARRFRKEGRTRTILKYFLNYLWIYFFNKPFVKEK